MKVVINNCHGGFGLSIDALREYLKRKGKKVYFYEVNFDTGMYTRMTLKEARQKYYFNGTPVTKNLGKAVSSHDIYTERHENDHVFSVHDIERNDPDLVAVVEELGEKADAKYSSLKIVEIPDDVEFIIQEHAGAEWIAEKHRTWG